MVTSKYAQVVDYVIIIISIISLIREGRWGTTVDFATNFLHFSLFSTALWDLANSRHVHSVMLSSHLFLCRPCLLSPSTVPCKMILDRPDEQETCPYHFGLRLFTIVRRSSCGPIAWWILARTSSLVTWSLYEMRGILRWHLIPVACILLWSSAVRVHDSQAYRKMDVTREGISRILELREILLSFQTGFNLVNAAVVCAVLESILGLEPSSDTPRLLLQINKWFTTTYFQNSHHQLYALLTKKSKLKQKGACE